MQVIKDLVSWNWGDPITRSMIDYYDALLTFGGSVVIISAAVWVLAKIHAYIMDCETVYPFSAKERYNSKWNKIRIGNCFLDHSCVGVFGTLFVGSVFFFCIMAWETVLTVSVIYGLIRTARGVVRLKKALNKHVEDKIAHPAEPEPPCGDLPTQTRMSVID